MNRDRVGTILRAIVHEFKVERITFMAGSIAYNAFLSLLPLLFLLLAVVSAVGDRELESTMISMTETIVTPGAGEVLVGELQHASVGASVVGLLALVWGMLRIFRSLDMAFSDIYETQAKNTLINQLKDGIVVFGSITAVILGVVAIESVFSVSGVSGPLWLFQRLFVLSVVMIALIPMYYLFPDESGMSVLEVLPGVFFTASALVVFQSGFSIYIEYSNQTAENTMLASILIFLTWLYFAGLVILTGAAINAVLSNRSEDVNIEPVIGGVPKTDVAAFEAADASVPDEALHKLNQSLSQASEVRITVDDEQEFTMPAPDIVTVDTDTSRLPAINDTASVDLQWAQNQTSRQSDQ